MEIKKIKTIYKCENVEIKQAVVSAREVTVQEGKVTDIASGTIKIDGRGFGFAVSSREDEDGQNNELVYNINRVPIGVDAYNIIKAFIAYIEQHINL